MKKTTSRHIIVKLLKPVTKKKKLTLARGKNTCLDRGTKVRGIIFSVEKNASKKQCNNLFQVLK